MGRTMNATCESLEVTLAEPDSFQVGGLHEQRHADRSAEYRGASKRKRCGGDSSNELPKQDVTSAGDKVPRSSDSRYNDRTADRHRQDDTEIDDRTADHLFVHRQDDTSSLFMTSVNVAPSVQTPDPLSMRRRSTDSSSHLLNPGNSAGTESSNRDVVECSIQVSDPISLTRTSTKDLNEAITQMTQQLVEQNSPTSLTRTKSKELGDVIDQLTQQLFEDVDCHGPAETDEAVFLGQENMPEFLLRDIEQFLSPGEDAPHQADQAEQAAAASSECISTIVSEPLFHEPMVLQQCSSELGGLQNLDVQVQQATHVVGPLVHTTWAPSVLEPTAAPHEPHATYVQQIQQYQIQQFQMQQMQMMQMQQVHMRQTQMMRAQLMFGQLVGEDMYVGKPVVMIAGKYRGRKAVVECRLKSKYRLKVEGVSQHLEFYSKQFAFPQAIRHKTSNNTELH